tara:strand:- start:317 stop:868 length:552 start_codon:yes stop_codon:yes gene_type:complete
MDRIIIIAITTIFLLACDSEKETTENTNDVEIKDQENTVAENKNETRIWIGDLVQKEGTYMYYKDERFTGVVFDLYDNNEMKIEYEMKGGLKNGYDKKWRFSGKMEYSKNLVDGKKHGTQEEWHTNGIKKTEENYKYGQKDGYFAKWAWNGNKTYECNYVKDKKIGQETHYFESGKIKSRTTY